MFALKTNAPVFTITELNCRHFLNFLEMDLNLESKQGLSLYLNLQYPESHDMFLVLNSTEWDTLYFLFVLLRMQLSVDSKICGGGGGGGYV